jgi:hypothetical protein
MTQAMEELIVCIYPQMQILVVSVTVLYTWSDTRQDSPFFHLGTSFDHLRWKPPK